MSTYYPPMLPLLDDAEMPPGAERLAPDRGDIVGRQDVSRGTDCRTVNLYCDHWYWSPPFGCIFIETYYLSPWDNVSGVKRKHITGKLIKGEKAHELEN